MVPTIMPGVWFLVILFTAVLLHSEKWRAALAPGAVGVAVWLLVSTYKYVLITCPECGFNPTKKVASDEWLSEDYMKRKLRAMEKCPKCGDTGSEGP